MLLPFFRIVVRFFFEQLEETGVALDSLEVGVEKGLVESQEYE